MIFSLFEGGLAASRWRHGQPDLTKSGRWLRDMLAAGSGPKYVPDLAERQEKQVEIGHR